MSTNDPRRTGAPESGADYLRSGPDSSGSAGPGHGRRRGAAAAVEMSLVIGIDPGLDGAAVVLTQDGAYLAHLDTPTLLITGGTKNKREHNIEAIAAWLREMHAIGGHQGAIAYLEYVRGIPHIGTRTQGASSIWAQGYGVGTWEGVLAGVGIPRVRVSPQRWKKAMMDGSGQGKDASRAIALRRFPNVAPLLARKRDVGRADALLIAEYGRTHP